MGKCSENCTENKTTQYRTCNTGNCNGPRMQTIDCTHECYNKHDNMDVANGNDPDDLNDIDCYQDESADFCKDKCNENTECGGYNYIHPDGVWGEKSGCCTKKRGSPTHVVDGIDFYEKNNS